VRKRGGRKRALGMRAPFTDGRRFRILAIVDDFTRQSWR
jgi:hypothetical protein